MRCSTRQRAVIATFGIAAFSLCVILMREQITANWQRFDKTILRPAIFYDSEEGTTQNHTHADQTAVNTITTTEEVTITPSEHVASTTPEDAMLREQKRRHRLLQEECLRLNISQSAPVDYSHMLVSDPHKILFNYIPKVSCKTWKALFGQLRKHNNTGKMTLGQYPAAERNARLASYRKVLFVREPLSRILSAYMSKFNGGVVYNHASLQRIWEQRFGGDIVRRYRGVNVSILPKGKWLNITLKEFMMYVTDLGSGIRMTVLNDHWLPQHIVSHPCQIKYDFIGHFENISTDGPYVLRWLGIDHLVGFPEYHNSNAVDNIVDYYQQVPLHLIHKVSKYYQVDYRLFGYTVEDIISRVTRVLFHDKYSVDTRY